MNRIEKSMSPNASRENASAENTAATPSRAGKRSKHNRPAWLTAFEALASLKLTVGLLILSVFMIWVATLQQVEKDIWDVKKEHFPALMVAIPLYTFFPPAWLPETRTYFQETQVMGQPIGVWLPSGFSIILAMILNLTAAHTLRFRIQGQGNALWIGGVITGIGLVVCAAVVMMGQSAGLQAQPPVPYSTMWNLILALMLVLGLAAAYWGWQLAPHRATERIMAGAGALTMLAVPVFLWYSGGFIGDSGMRILWQIAQCSVASLVLLAGLHFLFKRKAGIVLLHGGLLLLLGNEIWVVLTHIEQRISGVEGETVAYAYDIRDVELALIQPEGEQDRIIKIPSSLLRASEAAPDQWMPVPNTSLSFQVLNFYQNSDIGQPDAENPATAGLGTLIQAKPAPLASGVGQNEMNIASAYVRFRGQSEQDLGTYLVTQAYDFYSGPVFQTPNVLRDGDEQFVAAMWFKRTYKPYQLTINDVQSRNYPGTETPQWYASQFTIKDQDTGFSSEQMVWMNNPLRYRNETFYQSGYSKDPRTGIEVTTLQVVLNRGWMIPYLSCALVGIGILAQFIPVMLAYLDKQQLRSQSKSPRKLASDSGSAPLADSVNTPASLRPSLLPSDRGQWISTLAAVVVGLIFVGWGMPKRIAVDDLRLDALAQIPISYKGRIQPLDSLAQTMLRKSCGLEAARSAEETMFGKKKYPATRWLADLLFDPRQEVSYQVFRVDNRQVLDALKLPHRSGFRYAWNELEKGLGTLSELEKQARNKDKLERDNMDKSVLDLASNFAFARLVSKSLTAQPEQGLSLNARLFDAASTQSTSNLPGVIPGPEPGAPWLAPNVARTRDQLLRIGQEEQTQRSDEIAVAFIHRALAEALLADDDFASAFAETGEAVNWSPEQRLLELARRIGTLPANQIEVAVKNTLQLDPKGYLNAVFSGVQDVAGGTTIQPLNDTQRQALEAWEQIGAAYRDRDQPALDAAVAAYRTALTNDQAAEIPWGKVSAESALNGWSPFYLSSVMYLFASICATVGLFVAPASVRRFTWTLLAIAFLIHTIGLGARIYISGRAPVTSIYSSAVSISWGMVLAFLVIELGTKKGVANFMGGLTGFITLLVAYGLSLTDDTFAVLQAVLDTQFWLWTHVTIIALGYILTFVAGFWAIWMVVYSWSAKASPRDLKNAADITYGLICAATLLSFVGTVLGGLWADDSWGRFWGWDPKENGAAMIVLWNAAILHARWAGLIRFQGLAAMAIFGNIVTAWSWFAVNELGVGLHAYGFTEGVITFLTLFWLSQIGCMLLTLIPPRNRKYFQAT